MERERLLIIEDDEDIRTQLTYALQDEYDVSVAGDRTRAAAAVQEAPPEIVTLDLGLPPTPDTAEEGLRALEDILAVAPEAKVIIITGNGDRANAVAAVERGAFDYHLKPVNLDDLKVVLRRASFLQQLEIERVGGREVIPIDVRVVAATNQSLDEALRGGRFREDLYYRLSVVTIHLPPLRERGEDVVLLANAFLRRNAQSLKRKVRFSPEALEAIVKYQWPGN